MFNAPLTAQVAASGPVSQARPQHVAAGKHGPSFADVMTSQEPAPPAHRNLEFLQDRLANVSPPGDVRSAIEDFVTPTERSATDAFRDFMQQRRQSAHPLAMQIDTLRAARTALSDAMGSFDAASASVAREVLAELDVKIDMIKRQIMVDALSKVDGDTARD